MDYVPTIRPVMDMSDVTSGVRSINSMLNNQSSLNLATSISKDINKSNIGNYGTNSNKTSTPVVSFTQNNYSPKALSSIEVYRQTNNMISRIGKKVTQ